MKPVERAHVNVGAASHVGLNRKNNEDRYSVSAYRLETPRMEPSVLAVVADGVGGHLAGEVAAEIAVETIHEVVAHSDGSQPIQTLRNAFVLADQRIFQSAQTDSSRQGMGSTCACAWVIGNRLYTVSVGDTRIYLIHAGSIRQLTIDHTWVQEAVDKGFLTHEQAQGHPNSHVIRRFLGSKGGVVPDFRLRLGPEESNQQAEANQGAPLKSGDVLLLCSDGLTDLVSDDEILSAVEEHSIQNAIDALVAVANQRGGHDNITVVGLGMPEDQAETRPIVVQEQRRRPVGAGCITALAILTLALVLLAGYYWYQSQDGSLVLGTQTSTATLGTSIFMQETEGSPQPSTPTPRRATATLAETSVSTPASQPITPLSSTLTPWPTNTPQR